MNIHLIRHGQSEANINQVISCKLPGAKLTNKGIKQAQKLGEELFGLIKDVKSIYVSPFRRTVQTLASLCVDIKNCSLVPEERIRELDYGQYDNQKNSRIDPLIEKILKRVLRGDNTIRFGITGENEYELIHRLYSFIIDLIRKDEDSLVVTHDCVIVVLSALHSQLRGRVSVIKSIDNARIVSLDFTKEDVDRIEQYRGSYETQKYSPFLLTNNKDVYSQALFHPSVDLPDFAILMPLTFSFNKDCDVYFSCNEQELQNSLRKCVGSKWRGALVREARKKAGIDIDSIQVIGYIKIESLMGEVLSMRPEVVILPITISRLKKIDFDWISGRGGQQGIFTIPEVKKVLSERKDNNQMLEVFQYIINFVLN